MIRNVLVVGAGSAGLIAAIGLKRKIPHLEVRIVRSPNLEFFSEGESTTPNLPAYLFDFLGIRMRHIFEAVRPTWKLGTHFLWGPRPYFNYAFSRGLDAQVSLLPRPNGYYCDDDFTNIEPINGLMEAKKAFFRQPNGTPMISSSAAFHLDNKRFVAALEIVARDCGIEIIDGTIRTAERGPDGIEAVSLEDRRRLHADFFIDASDFRRELIGRLQEPFVGFENSLFCDRAIIGSWDRTEEPILPYTTAETMDCGWSWRIDHETTIDRGYVYCSSEISDDEARDEFLRKNPLIQVSDRVVEFRSGRLQRAWVGNTIAIGSAGGFVEPLESSALAMLCLQCESLITILQQCVLAPTPTIRKMYNDATAKAWDEIRNFLALHYKTNNRLNNAFWRRCNNDADVSGIADLLEFYEENGPTGLCRHFLRQGGGNFSGVEGFLAMLVGTKYPYRAKHQATLQELEIWKRYQSQVMTDAQSGINIEETLHYIHHPNWQWADEMQAATPAVSMPLDM